MNSINDSMFLYSDAGVERMKASASAAASSGAAASARVDGSVTARAQRSAAASAAGEGGRFAPANKELYNACSEFEAMFIKQMLDSMRKTVERTSLTDSPTESTGRDFFEDMLYDDYSKKMAKSADLGIAKMMYLQLYKSQS